MQIKQDVRDEQTYYGVGCTSMFASQYDQRFSYCLYVPLDILKDNNTPFPLIVLIHGSERGAQKYRDLFAEFGEQHRCIVLAPLFPCGIIEPYELHNYKYIKFHDIRFDNVLLAIVGEVAERYPLVKEKFLLHGFSGGGHFAHRFFYLHPERLMGVSIAAPGIVTLLEPKRDWWVGVGDIEQQFGKAINWEAMRKVPVQMVIGGDDNETWEIAITKDSRMWMEGAEDAGFNRLQRMEALKTSFEKAGIQVQHDIVPGVGHEGHKILEPVKNFFSKIIISWYGSKQNV